MYRYIGLFLQEIFLYVGYTIEKESECDMYKQYNS